MQMANQSFKIVCANSNTFASFNRKVLSEVSCDILCVQETRLSGCPKAGGPESEAKAKLKKKGFKALVEPGSHTDKGSISAGVLIAWKTTLSSISMGTIVPHRAVGAIIHMENLGQVLVISVYGHDSSWEKTQVDLAKILNWPPPQASLSFLRETSMRALS